MGICQDMLGCEISFPSITTCCSVELFKYIAMWIVKLECTSQASNESEFNMKMNSQFGIQAAGARKVEQLSLVELNHEGIGVTCYDCISF